MWFESLTVLRGGRCDGFTRFWKYSHKYRVPAGSSPAYTTNMKRRKYYQLAKKLYPEESKASWSFWAKCLENMHKAGEIDQLIQRGKDKGLIDNSYTLI